MRVERDLEKKIKQKIEEVQQLRENLYKAESYLEALQDSLKLFKKTSNAESNESVRPGSMVDKARKILLEANKPLYVGDILKGMGKEVNKGTRASLSGSLGSYVRENFIFTRPAPNTFGLIEFEDESEGDIPDNFGLENN